jgi:Zn-dependent peptidase ImmA (M78 family)
MCRHDNGLIAVRDDLDPAMQTKTLAHELAHAILHGPDCHVGRARG